MTLHDIYSDYITEDKKYECKGRLSRDNVLGWLKTVCGFANSKGGILFVGVEDKTGNLLGLDSKDVDKEKLFFYKTVKEHISSPVEINTSVIEYTIREKKLFVLLFVVEEAKMKPVILNYQGMPMIFVRRDGFTSPATVEEVVMLSTSNDKLSYDKSITDVKFNKDDFTILYKFYFDQTGLELSQKQLASIDFFSKEGYLSRGALLFKDDYKGNNSKVTCTTYQGKNRGDDRIVSSKSFSGDLISAYRFIYGFVDQWMNHGFIKLDNKRIDTQSYPSRSLFEAIINSLAHRDYFIDGSEIHVDLFINRLVISSPGNMYSSMDDIKTYKLDSFSSRRRNEIISNVFVLAKAMEAKGTGFEKILEDYKGKDDRHRPFIFTKNNTFSIVLPDLTYEDGVDFDDDSLEITKNSDLLGKYGSSILCYCYGTSRSVKEIATYLGVSDSSFFRKNILGNLVNDGLLTEESLSKGKRYLTNRENVKLR